MEGMSFLIARPDRNSLCIKSDTARTLLPGGAYASRTCTAIDALDARRAFSRSGNLFILFIHP